MNVSPLYASFGFCVRVNRFVDHHFANKRISRIRNEDVVRRVNENPCRQKQLGENGLSSISAVAANSIAGHGLNNQASRQNFADNIVIGVRTENIAC